MGKGVSLMKVSVVVPVFESEESLQSLVERVEAALSAVVDEHELILVNDGSTDGSWAVIERLTARYPWIRPINLMRNFGQHNAVLCGVRAAQYEVIATIDDDLQNPPEEIHKLLTELEQGFDVVYGVPEQEQHGLMRDLASQITKLAMANAIGVKTVRNVSAFRVFRTQVRNAFALYDGPAVSIDVLLTWGTSRFSAVKVRHDPRRLGSSKYTLRKLATHALNMLTGFSTVPLQLASGMGFVLTLFGIGLLVHVLARYFLEGTAPPGFYFLASIITIFSGAQLFGLGIIGEYLARIHMRNMGRPAYVARDNAPDRRSGTPHEEVAPPRQTSRPPQ